MRCLNCQESIKSYEANCENCGIYLPSLTREFLPVNQALHHGKYAISDYLGRGGFGLTYAAQQVLLKQRVAIKEFYLLESSHRLADHQTVSTAEQFKEAFQESLERFLREGQILAGLNHAHIVRVLDLFEENGTAYLVMEYLQGETLKQYKANQRPLPEREVQSLAAELVSALSALHVQGVYHLDLKPENIVKTEQGLKLIDFGSAKTTSSKTQTRYSYTESYAAPELLTSMGVKPAAQADLYELGVVLYEMLTGQLPPDPMQRAFNPGWEPVELPSPWKHLLTAALQLIPKQRPGDILAWWQGGFPNAQSSDYRPSVVSEEEKDCPYCAERIKVMAKKCRFCGEFLEESTSNFSSEPPLRRGIIMKPIISASNFSSGTIPPVMDVQERLEPKRVEKLQLKSFTNSLGMEFVLIQPGTFMMGSPESEESRFEDEVHHQVTLTRGFYLQTTPVTQEQWQALMRNNPSHFKGNDRPVERVSWRDCEAFIQNLIALGEWKYALPTEAQWEYACRAGRNTPYGIGNGYDLDSTQANFNGNYPYGAGKNGVSREETTPVKSFEPNAWGLYDMHGNVWEWCQDLYGYYPSDPVMDPVMDPVNRIDFRNRVLTLEDLKMSKGGAIGGPKKILRGGSYFYRARDCRSATRDSFEEWGIKPQIGFRLIRHLW